jgi:hypothetical protein
MSAYAAVAIAVAASMIMLATVAHAQDTLVTRRGVDWKCHDGLTVRFDSIGEKYEEGASTTLIITGLPRRRPNSLHISCGKRGCPLLDGKRCTIKD